MDRKELIRRGNVVTTEYTEVAETGRYLGNGRFGSVMSGLGLNMSPRQREKYPATGQSQYMHIRHWGRFRFVSDAMEKETSADYIIPMFQIHWEQEPEKVVNYRQCQDFYDGILKTSYEQNDGAKIQVLTWFDMVNKDLAGIRIDVSEGVFPVKVSSRMEVVPYAYLYKKKTHQDITVEQIGDNWRIGIVCEDTVNNLSSLIYFYSTAPVEICQDGLRFLVSKGRNEIYISYGEPVKQDEAYQSLEKTRERWHEIWENSGWFDFPEEPAQQMWVRSMAYLISTFDDDSGIIQPTNGLTGNMFPFNFVQDMQYVCPSLMMTGHVDIVKRWVEKFAGEIEDMKVYAKALWPEAEGIYPPWELPYGEIRGYHRDSVPIIYCYEPHNAGFLCRMAKEAADFVHDSEWTETYVHPLVKEVCEFYKTFCRKEEDGVWHLEWYPCIGQDEAGGRNKKDYLCCLYSAKYSFQTAVGYGLDSDGSYNQILSDGLAFESLMSDRGTYHTAYDADDFGKQKHPVQLNGLAYFPVEREPQIPECAAYEVRHDITDKAKVPFFSGWTLGEFLLAGSNLKNKEEWRRDWELIRASDYTDSQWVQLYETSKDREKSFYVTTHGMVFQSLIRNYVNDYWGDLDIASCPVFGGTVNFGSIMTRFGVTVSGVAEDGRTRVVLEALRDCEFMLNGNLLHMTRGEKRTMNL